jgi:transcriptional regulator of acetoin/glycerol metabolism
MKFFGEKIKRDTLSLFVGGVYRVSDAADQALQAHYKKLTLRNETETSLEQQRDKSPKRLKARVAKISEEDLAESRERSEDEYRLELIRRYQQDDAAPPQHRRLIEILEAARGNMTAAAQQLGVSRPVAYKYLKQNR